MKIRKNFFKILALLILSGNVMNAGYFKEKNRIYFTDEMKDLDKKEIVKNVDFRTFKIFEENDNFAKDKNNVYYKNKKVENVDVNSFQIESFLIAKDKNSVFFVARDEIVKFKGFSPERSEIFLQPFMPSILRNKDGIFTFDKYENGEITVKSIKTNEMDINSLEILRDTLIILYLKDKNNVYYVNYVENVENEDKNDYAENEEDYDDRRNMEIDIKKIIGADSGSFEVDGFYGKDKNNMYAFGKKLLGVNPKTFEIISKNGYLFKDDKNIYYFSKKEMKKLLNTDLSSFEEVAENEYYRDKNNVYYYDEYEGKVKKITGADSKTFEGISYTFGKDKNAVYKRENRLKGVDPATFEEIDASFTKDKNGVYYEEILMKGIDPKTFEPFANYTHVKDKNGVYSFSEEEGKVTVKKLKLPTGIDLKTLKRIENSFSYSKDKNNIYYLKSDYSDVEDDIYEYFEKIEGVDVRTFEVIDDPVGKDKNSVYYETQKITGADANSFEFLGYDFFKDKNNVYYKNKKLENIKPQNFDVINSSLVKQGENLYYNIEDENENIKFVPLENKNVDKETFEILDEDYTKDKNNAYYKGKILKEADVKTLDKHYNENDNGYKIKDKNRVYKIKEE